MDYRPGPECSTYSWISSSVWRRSRIGRTHERPYASGDESGLDVVGRGNRVPPNPTTEDAIASSKLDASSSGRRAGEFGVHTYRRGAKADPCSYPSVWLRVHRQRLFPKCQFPIGERLQRAASSRRQYGLVLSLHVVVGG